MTLVKAKISTVIDDQIPDFIREDHGVFVQFLKAYYEYLSTIENRNLENLRDIDNTLDSFIDYFAKEILNPIPKDILADKRLLVKRVKDLYLSKGNIDSYKLLFRILYDNSADVYVPKVDMLRVSDGKFSKDTIIRTTLVSGTPNELIGSVIYQGAGVYASVENVLLTRYLNEDVYELFINPASIVGDFKQSINIIGKSNIDNSDIILIPKTGIIKISLADRGLYYSIGDKITMKSSVGSGAFAEVTNVTTGSIKDIQVVTRGSGYRVGDEVNFDNTNSGGLGTVSSLISARAIVSEVDADSFLLESGEFLLNENSTQIDVEGTLTGGIKTIKVLDSGQNYKKLPIVTSTPSQLFGQPAKLISTSDDIGKIRSVSILNQGYDYSGDPLAVFDTNVIFRANEGQFSIGEKIVSVEQSIALEPDYDSGLLNEDGSKLLFERQEYCEANIKSIDIDRNIYTLTDSSIRIGIELQDSSGSLLDEDNNFLVKEESNLIKPNMTFVGQVSGAVAKVASGSSIGQAEGDGEVGVVYTTVGNFINADGKIGDSSKRIQDSKFYQDYSYQIRTTESINKYRDIVRKLLHPIGLALFGSLLHDGYAESNSKIPSSLLQNLQVSYIRLVINDLIGNSIHAMGNYRTNFEDFPEIKKSEFTLIIFDWLKTQMQMIPLNPEFLPEIEFPRLTPEEIFLLDLRVDAMHGDEWFYILFRVKPEWLIHRQTTLIMSPKILVGSRGVGPCWDSLERFKFTLPPFEAGSKGTLSYTPDASDAHRFASYYWAYYKDPENTGNTQIYHYADVVIGEVINNPYKKTNFAIDSFIDIISPVTYDSTYVTYDNTSLSNDNG
jgi:hypothetical protein